MSILLVQFNPDDSAHLRRLLAAALPAGHAPASIAVLPDVAAALAAVRRNAAYAVLLRLDQPPAADDSAASSLRELAAAAPLLAIMDDVDEGPVHAELGIQEYLALPRLDAPALATAIRYARDRKRLQDQLQASRSDLDLFAYTVAHDLKNQVFAAAGNADLLLADAGPDLSADMREMLADIFAASQRMTDIIQDLLLLSQLHTRAAMPAPVDMAAVLNEVNTRLVSELSPPPGLVIDGSPDAWPLALGFAPWIEEVWVRLIAAVAAGDPAPQVELAAQSELGGMVRFRVRGPGRGLAGSASHSAFGEPGRGGERAGRSLALALVRRLVTRMGGSVWAEQHPAGDSTLSFTLPAA